MGAQPAGRAETRLVLGGVATGKTRRLVGRVVDLLADGADPADILVVCATPDAAAQFARRLAVAAGDGVTVASARELELAVLAQPASREHTGRRPRLLAPFEASFLMEDLKVGGTPAGRLRGMLKFFYKSMADLADEEDGFLIDADEIDAMKRIKTTLAMTGGVLECELPGLAYRCVRDVPAVRSACGRAHVVVDDYQMLCRASQLAVDALAGETLWAAADPDACVEVFEPYPCASGPDELLERHPDAVVERLTSSHACQGALAAVNALRGDRDFGAPALDGNAGAVASGVRVENGGTPSGELGCAVRAVKAALGEGVDPEGVYVCVPNRVWEGNVCRALGQAGVAAVHPLDARPAVAGDIRDPERCAAARMLTLLLLAGDPTDGVAWRSWCGFGSYIVNSGIVNVLRDRADREGWGFVEALDALERGGDEFAEAGFDEERRRVLDAYAAGRRLLEGLRGLCGDGLLTRVAEQVAGEGAAVPAALRALCAGDAGAVEGDAAALRERALRRLAVPRIAGAPGAVTVGRLAHCVGRAPRVVVACGLVNGFWPGHDFFEATKTVPGKERKVRSDWLRRAYLLFGKARDGLVGTCFTKVELAAAGRLDLKVDRIWLDGDTRMATVSPSIVLEAAGLHVGEC